MATVLASNYNELLNTTIKNLGKPNFTEISTTLQKYTVIRNLVLAKNRQVVTGTGIQFNVNVNYNQSASNVGWGAADNVGLADSQVQASVPWAGRTTANYALMAEAISANSGPEQIVDMVNESRINCMIGLAEKMENNFWGPPVALSDTVTPWGVRTWFVKNATEGFNGGVPSGYTTIGLNPTTYANWKHWTAPYTSVSKDDFVRKFRQARVKCNFEPAADGIPSPNTGDKWGLYGNYSLMGLLEELLEAQNEDLGYDLASMDGKVVLGGMPFTYVPKLDADTTNPLYALNWGWFKFYVLKGWYMKETNVPFIPDQHTISVRYYDTIYQTVCKNRRSGGFVISNGTSEPS